MRLPWPLNSWFEFKLFIGYYLLRNKLHDLRWRLRCGATDPCGVRCQKRRFPPHVHHRAEVYWGEPATIMWTGSGRWMPR